MDGREDKKITEMQAGLEEQWDHDAFEKKYNAFLIELSELPCETKEDKKQRERFFQSHSVHDSFIMNLLDLCLPNAKKRKKRLSDDDSKYMKYLDIASYASKGKTIDPVVFTEAIHSVVKTYKGETGEKYCNIVVRVKKTYNQMAKTASAKNEVENAGLFDSEEPVKNLAPVMQTVYQAEKMYEREGLKETSRNKTLMEFAEDIMAQSNHSYTDKDRKLVKEMICGKRNVSLEGTISEDEDMVWGDVVGNGRDEAEEVLDYMENFCRNLETNLDLVVDSHNLKKMQNFKLFFTRDVLKALKRDGKKMVYTMEPAGNPAVYSYMEPQGDFFYGKMLYKKYLNRAFRQMPEDFYEVYAKLLKENFDFTDKILAEVEGKDKSVISRKKAHYLERMEILWAYYKENY